ncbi:MAG: B12-binding domain-containing radical SAM protein [Thermodesulfobacteriota bacterium]
MQYAMDDPLFDIVLLNINYSNHADAAEGLVPPLGLCYISSYLKNLSIKSKIIDANALNLKEEEIIGLLAKYRPRAVGISATTPTIVKAYETIDCIKSFFPGMVVIIGGPHPSALPRQTLEENKNIDIVVKGEGEITTRELVAAIKKNEGYRGIKGIIYREGTEIRVNPQRERIVDIDQLPFPDRSDLPIHKYRPSIKWYQRTPFTTIMTSRGCPNDCIFCASKNILGRTVRFRSPENVIAEIKLLIEQFGIKEIIFYDDTFTHNKKHAQRICECMLREKLDITWGCLSRVDKVDKPLLELMKKAGCHILSYGVESGNQEMLRRMRKKTKLEQIREAIKATTEAGIDISTSFVFGVPGETKASMEETIRFALEIDPLFAQFYRVVPFPGTDLFTMYLEQNAGEKIKWQEFLEVGNSDNLIKLDTITTADFNRLLKESYKRFYLRPSKILKILYKMSTPYKIQGLLRAFAAFMGIVVKKKQ